MNEGEVLALVSTLSQNRLTQAHFFFKYKFRKKGTFYLFSKKERRQ